MSPPATFGGLSTEGSGPSRRPSDAPRAGAAESRFKCNPLRWSRMRFRVAEYGIFVKWRCGVMFLTRRRCSKSGASLVPVTESKTREAMGAGMLGRPERMRVRGSAPSGRSGKFCQDWSGEISGLSADKPPHRFGRMDIASRQLHPAYQ